jgi:hypothetical protein
MGNMRSGMRDRQYKRMRTAIAEPMRLRRGQNFTKYRCRLQLVYFDWTIARSSARLAASLFVSYAVMVEGLAMDLASHQ